MLPCGCDPRCSYAASFPAERAADLAHPELPFLLDAALSGDTSDRPVISEWSRFKPSWWVHMEPSESAVEVTPTIVSASARSRRCAGGAASNHGPGSARSRQEDRLPPRQQFPARRLRRAGRFCLPGLFSKAAAGVGSN